MTSPTNAVVVCEQDTDDDLLSQLESELQSTNASVLTDPSPSNSSTSSSQHTDSTNSTGTHSSTSDTHSQPPQTESHIVNGVSLDVIKTVPEFLNLQNKYDALQKLCAEKDAEIKR